MKKIIGAILLSLCIIISSVPTMSLASDSSINLSSMNDKQKTQYYQSQLNLVKNLLKKHGIEPLSDAKVKALKLDKCTTPTMSLTASSDELENYIVNSQQQLNPIQMNDSVTVSLSQVQEGALIKTIVPQSTMQSVTTGATIDEIRYNTRDYSRTSTPLTNCSVTTCIAACYQYRFVQYPVSNPEYSNYKFISVADEGSVSLSTVSPNVPQMWELKQKVYSTGKITSATTIQNNYQYIAQNYSGLGISGTPFMIWIPGNSITITGTTNYSITN